jgi:hypothetical protein
MIITLKELEAPIDKNRRFEPCLSKSNLDYLTPAQNLPWVSFPKAFVGCVAQDFLYILKVCCLNAQCRGDDGPDTEPEVR